MKQFLDKSTLQGIVLMLAIGLALGFVNNLAAGPTRQLEWSKDYPPKGKPNCPETLPVPGEAAAPQASAPPVAPDPLASAGAPVTEAPADAVPPAEPAPGDAVAAATPATPADTAAATASAPASAPVAAAPAPVAAAAVPPPAAPAPAAAVEVPEVPPDKPWLELAPAQVEALFDRGALFVDARMTTQYQEGHIAGAIAIPIWESGVDEKVAQLVFDAEGDKARPIVVYCNGGDCEDSHNLGQKIWEAGHTAVYVYKDGYPDWLKRGRPVRTGDAR